MEIMFYSASNYNKISLTNIIYPAVKNQKQPKSSVLDFMLSKRKKNTIKERNLSQ